ncbi:MAG TPA: Os1348 family NHLP clan protein [Caldilineaceae bacterium]|nr:Os1348 family NHLP clan protein [Caldilineaceae bacterium]
MATQDEIDRLVGRLLLDPAFRQAFLNNPEEAAKDLDIKLNEKQLEHAKKFKEDKGKDKLDKLAGEVAEITVSGPYAWG